MDFDTLLEKMETSRPELSDSLSLIKQFQKSRADNNNQNNNEIDLEVGHIKELQSLLEKQKKINLGILGNYDQLKKNYQALLEHLDELAAAIGACPHCWGEERECNYCRGKGIPGYFQPAEQYFDIYIKPLINKLNNNKSIN